MSWHRLLLLGVITFGVMLVLSWPASRLLSTADSKSDLKLFGVDGTLRAGQVQGVTLKNRPVLENLRWRLSHWQLLLLRLGYEVSGGANDSAFRARISRSAFGRWQLKDFNGQFTLQSLAAAAGQSYLPLQGRAELTLDEVSWKKDQPPTAQGVLRLQELRWTLAQTPLPLGELEARVAPKGENLEVQIAGLKGPLEIEGSATYKPDRSYELRLQLRPKPGADPALLNLLRTLGPPDNQAWYHLRRNGSL